jgi:hypothetical protein
MMMTLPGNFRIHFVLRHIHAPTLALCVMALRSARRESEVPNAVFGRGNSETTRLQLPPVVLGTLLFLSLKRTRYSILKNLARVS